MKNVLSVLGGIGVFGAILLFGAGLIALWLYGVSWAIDNLLPFLFKASGFLLIALVVVLVPMAFVRYTRGYAGIGMVLISFLFGVTLWLLSFLIVASKWGTFWAIFGTVVFPSLPVFALLAAVFSGEWTALGSVLILIVATWGGRIWGTHLAGRADRESAEAISL